MWLLFTETVLCVPERRQEKLRVEAAGDGASGTGSGAPTRQATEEMDVEAPAPSQAAPNDHDKDGEDGKDGGKDNANHPPNKRYRLTETMRNIIWELVLLSNECCRLENEKNSLEGSGVLISDQGLRKVLYQKVRGFFGPAGVRQSVDRALCGLADCCNLP